MATLTARPAVMVHASLPYNGVMAVNRRFVGRAVRAGARTHVQLLRNPALGPWMDDAMLCLRAAGCPVLSDPDSWYVAVLYRLRSSRMDADAPEKAIGDACAAALFGTQRDSRGRTIHLDGGMGMVAGTMVKVHHLADQGLEVWIRADHTAGEPAWNDQSDDRHRGLLALLGFGGS